MMLQRERFWPIVRAGAAARGLLADPRFDPREKRRARTAALVEELRALFATRPRAEWAERC